MIKLLIIVLLISYVICEVLSLIMGGMFLLERLMIYKSITNYLRNKHGEYFDITINWKIDKHLVPSGLYNALGRRIFRKQYDINVCLDLKNDFRKDNELWTKERRSDSIFSYHTICNKEFMDTYGARSLNEKALKIVNSINKNDIKRYKRNIKLEKILN